MEEIESSREPIYLRKAKKVKRYIENKEDKQLPLLASPDKEERNIACEYLIIKRELIKPYLDLDNKEREEYKAIHPEIDEVLEILEEIHSKQIPKNLKKIMMVEEWMEKNNGKTPSAVSKNEEEKKLGKAYSFMKTIVIKPYLELETEKEKEIYRFNHVKLDEMIERIIQIESTRKGNLTNKRFELLRLMRMDSEKRSKVKKARKLEKKYKELLNKKVDKGEK